MKTFRDEAREVVCRIYGELTKKGELGFDDLLRIYETNEFPIFRKTGRFISEELENKTDVEIFKDKKGNTCLRLIGMKEEKQDGC